MCLRLQNDDPEYYNDLPGKVPPEPHVQESPGPGSKRNENLGGKESREKSVISGQRTRETPTLTLPTGDKGETSPCHDSYKVMLSFTFYSLLWGQKVNLFSRISVKPR
jgi:hypothetical protein